MFNKIKLSTRIIGIVSFLLVMLCTISLFSLRQIHHLELEIDEIAEDNVPLMRVVSTLTKYQLEQATHFGALVQFAYLKEKEKFEEEVRGFREAGRRVSDVVKQGRKIAGEGVKHADDDAQRKEFATIETMLGIIEKEHGDYEHHTEEMFQKMAQMMGDSKEAVNRQEMVAAVVRMVEETRHLEERFDEVVEHLDAITKALTEEAHAVQKLAYRVLIPLSIFSLGGGLLIAILIVSNIVRTLRKTMDQLSGGSMEISSASHQVATASQYLADQAASQAAALEEASASLSHIAGLARDNSSIIERSHELIAQSHDTIQSTKNMLGRSQQTSQRLHADLGEQLPRQLGSLNEALLQLNLLATNASVEASRSQATQGFSILTQEMKRFAEQCLEGIRSLQTQAREASKDLNQDQQIRTATVREFAHITDITTRLKQYLDQLNSKAAEYAGSVGELDQVMLSLSNSVETYAATSEESAAASEELSAQAHHMMDIVQDIAVLMGGSKPAKTAGGGKPGAAANK